MGPLQQRLHPLAQTSSYDTVRSHGEHSGTLFPQFFVLTQILCSENFLLKHIIKTQILSL